jgi:hypothetical protein
VKPRSRTIAAAALGPSAFASCCVNAGSGAACVVVVAVPVVVVGVVAVLVVLALVCVFVVVDVCETGGTLDTVTVFVCEPQATSSAAMHAHSAVKIARKTVGLICPWYSPLARALLAWSRPGARQARNARPVAARPDPAERPTIIISDC